MTATEAGRMPPVGALSERPSASAGGRSESAPTRETRWNARSQKRLLLDFCYNPDEYCQTSFDVLHAPFTNISELAPIRCCHAFAHSFRMVPLCIEKRFASSS